MARKPRIHIPGGIYHVMIRGNAGQDIFLSNDDRCHFLLLIQEGVGRFGCRVHAFCLMDNHVHLAIQVSDMPLSKIMQNLSFRYTRWFNRRQKRIGHLFQGRYKAILVDKEAYLLELVRYIHLNPIRAGIVDNIVSYEWSGHRTYLGMDSLACLTVDYVLGQFADHDVQSRQRYTAFINDGLESGYRPDFHQGGEDSRLLGDDRFIEDTMEYLQISPTIIPDLDTIITCVCEEYDMIEEELSAKGRARLQAEARAVIGYLTNIFNSGTVSEVSRRFGRDIATLSGAIRKIRLRSQSENEFGRSLEYLQEKIISKRKDSKQQ